MGASQDKTAKKIAIQLGHAIRARREGEELSQDELAWRADIHRAYMGTIERGEQNITVFKLFQIARGLGVSPSELLQDIGL